VRHLAWLNAAFDKDGLQTRRDFYEAQNLDILMPECDATYILDYLFELGICPSGEPLTHSEIAAWQQNTGIELESFDARIIKKLSVAYVQEQSDAKQIDAETAWSDAPKYMRADYIKGMTLKAAIRKLV